MKNKLKRYFSTLNSQLSSQRAFTLVELLVVMAVLVAIGAIIAAILFSSLRGANKTDTLTVLRQNGNYVISQISKMVRNAKRLDGVSLDGVNYVTSCSQAQSQYAYIRILSFDEQLTTFACTQTTISSNSASLLDTNVVSLDSGSCYFTCSQNSDTDYPVIGINFSLSRKQAEGSAGLPERSAQIGFQTSITPRNLSR